jgi:polyphosphate kinase
MPQLNIAQNFINRELSWLKFNTRVLEEANDTNHKILERLKFLAIYGTNLDEFYMIRVAGLKEIYKLGLNTASSEGLTTKEQLYKIREYLQNELYALEKTFLSISKELKNNGVEIKEYNLLNQVQKKVADKFFYSHLYPIIIPIAIDSTHPFPHFNNLSFAIVVKLEEEDTKEIRFGLVRIPRLLPRFFEFDGVFIPIESIVHGHIKDIFAGFKAISIASFRITRNADIVIEEEEADDFLDVLEEGIRSRRKGEVVRLELGQCKDEELIDFLKSHLDIDINDIYYYSTPLNYGAFWEIVGHKNFAHLLSEPYTPKTLMPLYGNISVMETIEHQDIALFLPYESFDPVVKFIKEAANDPLVLAIKMTLYRVGKNSPIVKSLIEAAKDGKQVTAVVELKARFDEENNLKWAKKLEDAGAHVIYGIVGLKIHAKAALVIKQTENGLKQYVHLSTGNYNPVTSRIYTDLSFFTTDKEIANDITKFFHHITGFAKRTKLNILTMSPLDMKPKILSLINNEKKHKSKGRIIAKMNSLVDEDIILALYEASNEGVKIDLIIRGICCLRPGVKGVSENIRVISIVGKYLEHTRSFYFEHSTPKVYFSSADWMPRNLLKRIELLTPVFDEDISKSIHEMMLMQLRDTLKARVLKSNAEYEKLTSKDQIDTQHIMEEVITTAYKENIREQKRSTKETILKAKQ